MKAWMLAAAKAVGVCFFRIGLDEVIGAGPRAVVVFWVTLLALLIAGRAVQKRKQR